MKTTLEKVFETLNKVELKSDKIELSIVDDIKDAVQRGIKIQKELKSSLSSYNGLIRSGGIINKKMIEAEKIGKELGVKMPSELKKFKEIANEMDKQGNALKKAYNLF